LCGSFIFYGFCTATLNRVTMVLTRIWYPTRHFFSFILSLRNNPTLGHSWWLDVRLSQGPQPRMPLSQWCLSL
jgi:hypothetical protein